MAYAAASEAIDAYFKQEQIKHFEAGCNNTIMLTIQYVLIIYTK